MSSRSTTTQKESVHRAAPRGIRLPADGRFDAFGGCYVPEVLVDAVHELESAARAAFQDAEFLEQLGVEARQWIGRPTPLTRAPHLERAWGAEIWLKREDLAHTGAHKINNALGQALLAQRMGKTRVLAETGAGQHGVATAAACARLGLACRVFMGALDAERQAPNVARMKFFGAEVIAVTSGGATLRAAINEALRAWSDDPRNSFYLLGSAVGPHPYPSLVAELQRVIGDEAKQELWKQRGVLPDAAVACVGGGSNAIGLFRAFLEEQDVRCVGVEAGGRGDAPGEHGATLERGRPGVLHGARSYLLQDDAGQVQATHSISAGLDYPGVGPEHAALAESGRAEYRSVSDQQALVALRECARLEGILPALESAHALAGARQLAHEAPGSVLLVNLSGRGDKDIDILMDRGGLT